MLPLLTNHIVSLLTRGGQVYSTCIRCVMLHAAESYSMTLVTLNRLRRNNCAMIHWICNIKAKDSHSELLTQFYESGLILIGPRQFRLRMKLVQITFSQCLASRTWIRFGHVEHSTGFIAELFKLNVITH